MSIKTRSQLPAPISTRSFDGREQQRHEPRSPASLTRSRSGTSSLPGIRTLRKAFQLGSSKKDTLTSSDRQLTQSVTGRNVISKSPTARSSLPVPVPASNIPHNVSHVRSLSNDSAPLLLPPATIRSLPAAKPISIGAMKHVLPAPPEPMASLSSPLARPSRQLPRPVPMRISGEMPSIGMTVSQSLPASSLSWTTPQSTARLPKEFIPSAKQNTFTSRLPHMTNGAASAKDVSSISSNLQANSIPPVLASTSTYTLYLKPDFVRGKESRVEAASVHSKDKATLPRQEISDDSAALIVSLVPETANSPRSMSSLQSFETGHSSEGYSFPYSSHLQKNSSRSESRTSPKLSGGARTNVEAKSGTSPIAIDAAVRVWPSSSNGRNSPNSPLSELVNRLSTQVSKDNVLLSAADGQQRGLGLRRTSRNSLYSAQQMDEHSLRSDEEDALQTLSAEGSDASPLIPQDKDDANGESLPEFRAASVTAAPARHASFETGAPQREVDAVSNASKSWTMNDVEEAYDRMRSHLHAAGRRVSEVTEGDVASLGQPDQMPTVDLQYIERLLTGTDQKIESAATQNDNKSHHPAIVQHLRVNPDTARPQSSQNSSRRGTPSSRSSGQWAEITPTSQTMSLPHSATTTVSRFSSQAKRRALSPDNFLELDTTHDDAKMPEQPAIPAMPPGVKESDKSDVTATPNRLRATQGQAGHQPKVPNPSGNAYEDDMDQLVQANGVPVSTAKSLAKLKPAPPSRLHLPMTPRSAGRTSGSVTPTTWFDDTPRMKRISATTTAQSRLPRMNSDRSPQSADATSAIHDAKKADKLDLFLRCAKAESAHAALLQQSELEREALLDALQESRTAIVYLREERSALQKALAQSQHEKDAM